MTEEKDSFDKISSNLLVKVFVTLLGIAGAVVTIYTAFFQEETVNVQYVITANANVLDINANISKLDIIYDSTSLKQKNENLKILNIKVINTGEADVLKNYFDENEPLGFEISNGEIIEQPELIETSSDYISKNLKIRYPNHKQAIFSQVILESEEYFVVKVLILHKNEETPEVLPIGKIAGQKEIGIINASEVKEERPFLVETFFGNIWIQIVRLIAYFIFIVILVIIMISVSEKLNDIRTDKRRKKNVKNFKEQTDYDHNRMNDAIFDRYLRHGSESFRTMRNLVTNERELNSLYKESLSRLKKQKDSEDEIDLRYDYNRLDYNWEVLNEMINDGLLLKDGSKLSVNQPMKTCLIKFSGFLKERGDLNRREHFELLNPRDQPLE